MSEDTTKFRLDAFDGDKLWIIPNEDDWDSSLFGVMEDLPEKQWRNVGGTKGWAAPGTEATIKYIEKFYIEGKDYLVTENAKILIKFDKITHALDHAKAQRRWEYLFNDVLSDFVVPSMLPPFDHQRVAVEAAYGSEYFGLLMEMGTGKTKCIIDEVQRMACMLDAGEMLRVLIVCPKSLRVNWEREILKNFSDIFNVAIAVLNGEMKSIETLINLVRDSARIKVAIVSYDSVSSMLGQLKAFKPNFVAFDESHYIKNPESKRWKAANELAKDVPMRRILTGTPVANTILDIWAQFQILRPGALGYGTYAGFKRAYCDIVQTGGGFDKISGFKNVEQLKENMARMSFIVKKEHCLDLPEKMYDTVSIEMPETIRDMYIKFAQEFYVMLDTRSDISTEFIIVQMLKLSQIACGFVTARVLKDATLMADDGNVFEDPEHYESQLVELPDGTYKLDEMMDDVEEVTKEGKLIIWSRFRHSNKQIVDACLKRGILAASFDGGTKDADRQVIIDRFNGDDKFRVFVGNPGSGGVGLTLLGTKTAPCHTTFFYSNDFSYGKRLQAEDRCHRIGQTNSVIYKDYVAKGTIEEYIAARLQQKKDLSEAVKDVGEIKNLLLKQKEQFGG